MHRFPPGPHSRQEQRCDTVTDPRARGDPAGAARRAVVPAAFRHRGAMTAPAPGRDDRGRLAGQVVTGGGTGIGPPRWRGPGRALGSSWWRPEPLQETVREVLSLGARRSALGTRCSAVTVDVVDDAAVQRHVDETVDGCGRVDVLVNNARCERAAARPGRAVGRGLACGGRGQPHRHVPHDEGLPAPDTPAGLGHRRQRVLDGWLPGHQQGLHGPAGSVASTSTIWRVLAAVANTPGMLAAVRRSGGPAPRRETGRGWPAVS